LSAWSFLGRLRGRPRPCRTPGTASRVGASMRLSCRLAGLRRTPRGVPFRSTTRWRFVPGWARDPSGWDRSRPPPFGRHGGAVQAGSAPVQMPCIRQALEQHAVQAGPNAHHVPVAQASPASHAGAAQLARQHLPRHARAQHEDDADQGHAIIAAGSATPGLGWLGGQQQLNGRPKVVGNKELAHSPSTPELRFC
jgi:hypothetical protein